MTPENILADSQAQLIVNREGSKALLQLKLKHRLVWHQIDKYGGGGVEGGGEGAGRGGLLAVSSLQVHFGETRPFQNTVKEVHFGPEASTLLCLCEGI